MNRLTEALKLDIGIESKSQTSGNATGVYYDMKNYRRALAILIVAAIAATKKAKVELLQAKDTAGTDAKGIPSTSGQLATAEITANALVTAAKVTLATFLATGTITINGLVFTAHASTTTVANREFSIAGTTDTDDAAELVTCINDATYGVPGITASNAAGVVTLKATDPGETLITISSSPDDGTVVKATLKAQAFVEIDVDELDIQNGFSHIAAKVTTDATIVVSIELLRGEPRFAPPAQKVAASALL